MGSIAMSSATPAELGALFRSAAHVVFLTGAGISTDSGIPDFRSAAGLYTTGVNENVFDLAAFQRDPRPFYRFARDFYPVVAAARPNAAHRAIADLALAGPWRVTVVTQNVDTLHQDTGSPAAVHPVHGSWSTSHCCACGVAMETAALLPAIARGELPVHAGSCGGVYKPDITFFGENLPAAELAAAEAAVRQADLLVIVGTSLAVYPAAALPAVRRAGCRLAVINHDPTPLDAAARLCFHDSAGTVLGTAVATALA